MSYSVYNHPTGQANVIKHNDYDPTEYKVIEHPSGDIQVSQRCNGGCGATIKMTFSPVNFDKLIQTLYHGRISSDRLCHVCSRNKESNND